MATARQATTEDPAARLAAADLLSGLSAPLLAVDAEGVIQRVNPALEALAEARRRDLAAEAPGFAGFSQGERLDEVLPVLRRTLRRVDRGAAFSETLETGEAVLELAIAPVTDADGAVVGATVEWDDQTERRAREAQQAEAERQIEALIGDILAGRLDERIETDGLEGFVARLGEGINRIMESIGRPVRDAAHVLDGLAEGNLERKMEGDYQGEFGRLQESLNQSVGNLRNIVHEITEATGNVGSAASEISQGNQDLSQRTEEQASSLEETASSMEELTSTVRQNAENARQSRQLAGGAREQAEKGGEIADQAVTAMGGIKDSSKRIADIITVIDEIAFQTNLLALNAAVEAARAGEHGRGFGVVAGEVRNLAQRSAEAAKEIKGLIQDSGERVDEGTRLVDAANEALQSIVKSVKQVSDNVEEISAASDEQSAGIEQVNKAVTQLDEVTQQNAALVEQAAAASESLDEQARSLSGMMAFFGGAEAAAPPSRPAKPAAGTGQRPQAGGGKGAGNGSARARGNGGAGARGNGSARAGSKGSGNGSTPAAARRPAAGNGDAAAPAPRAAAGGDEEWEEF